MKAHLLILLYCTVFFFACSGEKVEEKEEVQAYAVDGSPLYIPERSDEATSALEANLKEAETNYKAESNEMNTIWLGRRWAYLTNYNKAIGVFSDGIKQFPNSYKLYRHRGHRYISTRQFEKAEADYKKAFELMDKEKIEVEPDGAPNSMNIPLSNTQFNILYHYGLALYLQGKFEEATEIYKECLKYSVNDDLLVATTDWLYMSLMREGKAEEATAVLEPIHSEMTIIENDSYYKRIMMYKGELAKEELLRTDQMDVALSLATQGYGMGNWYLYNGDTAKAKEIFQKVIDTGNWPAFGYVAAEVDLHKLKD
ncbi:tetratricopeptide repeat protein [uncultured Roseivirga sp.]|uniref:tetratricopeptide repeat protein n=2 Tax=uncultured Roseivirga sp. TaxID=543088 RepID=UPI0030D6F078|tara:strand:- start:175972 stop:176907 length:936 start_codon:yes stop_codon:yes gene_type:complete